MFQYVQNDSGLSSLFDDERGVSFRVVAGIALSNILAALMTWGDRQIPLEFALVHRTDDVTGESYGMYGFNLFGSSAAVQKRAGVGHYDFRDNKERAEARLLAIEAILVYAHRMAEGKWNVEAARVLSEGREWKASDFGYDSSKSTKGSGR